MAVKVPLSPSADPMRYRGCTELLPHLAVFKWNGQAASALPPLWVLCHISMIVSERSHQAVRNTHLTCQYRDRSSIGLPGVVDLNRSLILSHELSALTKSNICPFLV